MFLKCDVTLNEDWMNMWDQAEHALGGKIEILCNNAGVPAKVDNIVIDRPQICRFELQAGMDTTLAVMTFGATFGVAYALERMGVSKGGLGGRIITTASTAGLTVSKDHFGLSCGLDGGGYAISKHANVALTQMFPHLNPKPSEDGVKAYSLCPSGVPTRMILGDVKQT